MRPFRLATQSSQPAGHRPGTAAVEFAVVELDVAADARGLGDDGSEVCAMALPNTNVDTRTAAITFIKVSMGDMRSCEALEQGSSQSHRYLTVTIT